MNRVFRPFFACDIVRPLMYTAIIPSSPLPMQPYTTFQNAVLLIMRVMLAAIFLVAGYYKFPFWSAQPSAEMPAMMLNLTLLLSVVEPLGGAAVLLGFLTRWASAGLAIIMVGAVLVTKFMMGIGFVTPTGAGWNFPLIILGGCLILMAFGAGKWSAEGMMNKKM